MVAGMRINLLAAGTRGDVQPAIALGLGLKKAGFTVQLVAFEEFRPLAGMVGLDFFPLQSRVQELMKPSLTGMVDSGTAAFGILPVLLKLFRELFLQMTVDFLRASQEGDVLISNAATAMPAAAVAEKLDVPHIETSVFPGWPTRAFPSIFWPRPASMESGEKSLRAAARGMFNLSTYVPMGWFVRLGFRPVIKHCRTEILNLPPRAPRQSKRAEKPIPPVLAGFSEHVLPRPADWGENIRVTGYWSLDTPAYTPPPALQAFLECGLPPVYVGFGSMPSRDPEQVATLVTRALTLAGQRGIILTGQGPMGCGMTQQGGNESVYFVDSIPHDWLLPRVAAVVHHGGAGTTAAGIRAGVPSVLIPILGDQLFWSQRVADLGVGVRPIPRKNLTAERLAAAIHQVVNDSFMRQRAAALGKKIRAEDGVGQAVRVICQYLRV
jgi:UDP:flavonoid glycosyltransferase YjiC (YdhE family)